MAKRADNQPHVYLAFVLKQQRRRRPTDNTQRDCPRPTGRYSGPQSETISSTSPAVRFAPSTHAHSPPQLAQQNASTYDRIAKNQLIVERTERQIKEILSDFAKVFALSPFFRSSSAVELTRCTAQSMAILKTIDADGIEELQNKLVEAVPAEGV